ncbi:hypothetical protein ABIE09_000465 [Lysobacter enzymogenes]|uniref:DUF6519 domain-containing protein n=1 Tax=Lysobacter enzymogenes TaxID=69 RepID=UPI003399921C
MKGDFSRVSFDPRNHFSQVLLQQGRVTLDADPNEQSAILLHYLRTLARDLFGPYAAPVDNAGFDLQLQGEDGALSLAIGAGRYYVQGILCESEGCDYIDQPHFRPQPQGKDTGSGDPLRRWLESSSRDDDARFWVYLKVWERHITSVEWPSLREVALGGPDTCSRAQVVWQVRALALEEIESALKERYEATKQRLGTTQDAAEQARLQQRLDDLHERISQLSEDYRQGCAAPLALFERDAPSLAARLQPPERLDDPCIVSPDAEYRGAENQLYRVEIHRGNEDGAVATFKWSRDNGSVLTRWIGGGGSRLEVANPRDFRDAQWIELSDEDDDLLGQSGSLCRIASVEGNVLILTAEQDRLAGPGTKVRRWDQSANGDIRLRDGAVPVTDNNGDYEWIDLEDGVQVRFAADGDYRSGDYWLIPARTTGRIDWPQDAAGQPVYQPPRGADAQYAPLGFVGPNSDGNPSAETPCRCLVHPTSTCGLLQGRVREDAVRAPAKPVADTTATAAAPAAVAKAQTAKTQATKTAKSTVTRKDA